MKGLALAVVLRVCVLVWLIAYLSGAYVAAARQNGSNSSGTDAGSSTDSNSSSDVRSSGASAQQATPTPALITQAVDDRVRTRLVGNVHPLAQTKFDQGEAPADMPMQRMLLVLKRSAQQEAALRGLIDAQQNKNSANFHQWLTPAEFGAQFGPGGFRYRGGDRLVASERIPGVAAQQRPDGDRIFGDGWPGEASVSDGNPQIRGEGRATLGECQRAFNSHGAGAGGGGGGDAAQFSAAVLCDVARNAVAGSAQPRRSAAALHVHTAADDLLRAGACRFRDDL